MITKPDLIFFEYPEKFLDSLDYKSHNIKKKDIKNIIKNNIYNTEDLDQTGGYYMISYEGFLMSRKHEEYRIILNNFVTEKPIDEQTKGEFWLNEFFDGIIRISSVVEENIILINLKFENGVLKNLEISGSQKQKKSSIIDKICLAFSKFLH